MENMVINHWAVLTCAVFNLIWGAFWYSPVLFYKAWKTENNLTDDQIKSASPAKTYGVTFVLAYLISYNMAFFLGDAGTTFEWGLTAGFLTGFGWAAAIFTIIALFEQRSWKYILINGGYIVIYFTVIGGILGFWR
ncbi:DUF1761 domain-containing protein [Muricauda sp. CAU 1633]|uniref:DUF1761 domain-containing protein n=1 Tax=Allomuricauda sp. CAU 1633 TaxID=2816036 RepID=UPI001A8C1F4C|nr:DUF1761 domain-containing protein [Muricauda sp. CAU 1633]MBO0321545.1 DUF1761 domain-containing protein [Muricauda sp. CAU 1633]